MGTYSRRLDTRNGRIIYKEVQLVNGDTLRLYGANRPAMLHSCHSGEHKGDSFFFHYGRKYYLSEFLHWFPSVEGDNWMDEFHGYMNDSAFSGVVIKLDDTGESVKAFTYY